MLSFNTPLLIVGVFLVLALVIGLFRKPATTFREYAVGNKRFPTAILVASLLATILSGGKLIKCIAEGYHYGLWNIFQSKFGHM
ncbi:hypothetical protein [Cardinium endosymbiont of Bemisia tabaci]|uniref:hypothetical protein n=1 Tax=Candidatus Cardinium TaxID=273135 RepID=UPI000442D238|nr:hypothetical protein [Cardinium endosymbiont of Bemisia tabaci]CDG49961.1 hypothetical protein CHV_c0040 [Cardinium endosymbiont cBtQ1 of Bemisia tabaci]